MQGRSLEIFPSLPSCCEWRPETPYPDVVRVILGSLWDMLLQCPRKGTVIPVLEDENSWCLRCLQSFLKPRGCKTNAQNSLSCSVCGELERMRGSEVTDTALGAEA